MSSGVLNPWRVRLVAWSAALVALAFAQAPGQVAGDTKLDLVVDPGAFLGRALHLWDASGAYGQVQNQAYGYLFPMGPFFGLGDLVGLPPWVVQRLWWSLVLVVAFLGVVKLLGALRVGVGWTRVLAALAYALSPRILTILGASSIEAWPAALAPWVLVPLVLATRGRDPRRAALWSAVAVACVGGVNAAATFAVIPMAAWCIWSLPAGPRRRVLLTWWPPAVLLATAWWLAPLFLLGRYSPPFLDYIESIANTSFAATTSDALRGTTNWVAYVDPGSAAGEAFLSDRLLALNVAVVVTLGLLGLARADLPARRLLVPPLLLGLVMVTAGHLGSTTGWGSETVRALLDGSLAPLRNTHKFDVLVRLPLVVGLCHACTVLTRPQVVGKVAAAAMVVVSVTGVVGASSPAWSAQAAPRGTFNGVPDYWREAATWLEADANGRALLTPASTFGRYVWGRTNDEPLQALMSSPWGVRNVIPLTPGANIDMLDTVSRALQEGQGSEALAAFLRRSGVGTVIVRHDLDQAQVDVESPETVRSTLLSTPGMERVATFGPEIGGDPTFTTLDGRVVLADDARRAERPAIEIFSLEDPVPTQAQEDAPDTVVGDSGSLLRLDDTGLTDGGSSVLAPDQDGPLTGRLLLTDGNRRQEAAFAQVRRNRSASLTRQEPYRTDRDVHRYDEARLARWSTVPELVGARSLTASSSRSDVGARPSLRQDASPWAAFDDDPDTAWRPDAGQGPVAWLDLDLGRRRDVGTVTITLPLDDGAGRSLRVSTEKGVVKVPVQSRQAVVDVGTVRHLRISARRSGDEVAISGVAMQNVQVTRPLRLPSTPAAWGAPDGILLQTETGANGGCLTVDEVVRCADAFVERTEDGRTMDRIVPMKAAGTYRSGLRVVPEAGAALDELLQRGRLATVAVSSQGSASALGGALATVDGSPSSGWVADRDDLDPTLTVRWVEPRRLTTIQLGTARSTAATPPRSARVVFSDGSEQTVPVVDGALRLDPVRTSFAEIHLKPGPARLSVDFGGIAVGLPVGVGEVKVPGVSGFASLTSEDVVRIPCKEGPTLEVDGVVRRASVRTTTSGLVSGRAVPTTWCDNADTTSWAAGDHRVVARGTAALRPQDVELRRDDATVVAGASVERTTHNENVGWKAKADGKALSPVVLNGWQQGWRLPAATDGPVRETFAPGGPYRVALGVGALLLVVLLGLAVLVRPARLPEEEGADAASRGSGPLLLVGLAAAAALVAGAPVLVAAVVTSAVVLGLRGRWSPLPAVLAAAAGAVATLAYVVRPWAGDAVWAGDLLAPQVLSWVAVSAVVTAAGVVRPGPLSLKRRKGRSTSR